MSTVCPVPEPGTTIDPYYYNCFFNRLCQLGKRFMFVRTGMHIPCDNAVMLRAWDENEVRNVLNVIRRGKPVKLDGNPAIRFPSDLTVLQQLGASACNEEKVQAGEYVKAEHFNTMYNYAKQIAQSIANEAGDDIAYVATYFWSPIKEHVEDFINGRIKEINDDMVNSVYKYVLDSFSNEKLAKAFADLFKKQKISRDFEEVYISRGKICFYEMHMEDIIFICLDVYTAAYGVSLPFIKNEIFKKFLEKEIPLMKTGDVVHADDWKLVIEVINNISISTFKPFILCIVPWLYAEGMDILLTPEKKRENANNVVIVSPNDLNQPDLVNAIRQTFNRNNPYSEQWPDYYYLLWKVVNFALYNVVAVVPEVYQCETKWGIEGEYRGDCVYFSDCGNPGPWWECCNEGNCGKPGRWKTDTVFFDWLQVVGYSYSRPYPVVIMGKIIAKEIELIYNRYCCLITKTDNELQSCKRKVSSIVKNMLPKNKDSFMFYLFWGGHNTVVNLVPDVIVICERTKPGCVRCKIFKLPWEIGLFYPYRDIRQVIGVWVHRRLSEIADYLNKVGKFIPPFTRCRSFRSRWWDYAQDYCKRPLRGSACPERKGDPAMPILVGYYTVCYNKFTKKYDITYSVNRQREGDKI